MVLGTGSHVGKSLLVTALCRILVQDGYRVAPFKAQNMSLNSAATPEGGEIGRAQALQAEACGLVPSVDMNPILLKPTSDRRSQVILRGAIWETMDAFTYHRRRIDDLFPLVCESYEHLAERYDVIVLEGAGSPVELNLKDADLVNMRMAQAADARCLLLGDIERGGVFASLYGTMRLLDDRERRRITGFAVNKFRGDPALFSGGVALLEELLERPCFGVIPYLRDIGLEEEDGVAIEELRIARRPPWKDGGGNARRTRIAVVAWPHLSNFTDFDAFALESSVEFAFVEEPAALAGADLVVLPGTKATLAALQWLRDRGFAEALAAAAETGYVFGICGGMQVLGRRIDDPTGVEGGGAAEGLHLLPIRTTLASRKVTELSAGRTRAATLFGVPFASEVRGYEIHVGETLYDPGARPFARIAYERGGRPFDDGAHDAGGRVAGSYLHGLFADDGFRHEFLRALRAARGLAPADHYARVSVERAARLDRLADHVRAALDVPRLLGAVAARA